MTRRRRPHLWSGILCIAALACGCGETQRVAMSGSKASTGEAPPPANSAASLAVAADFGDADAVHSKTVLNLTQQIERAALAARETIPSMQEAPVVDSDEASASLNLVDEPTFRGWVLERNRLQARIRGGIAADRAACEAQARAGQPALQVIPERNAWLNQCTQARGTPLRTRINEVEERRNELRAALNRHCVAGASGDDHRKIPADKRWPSATCHEKRATLRERIEVLTSLYNQLMAVGLECDQAYANLVKTVAEQNNIAQSVINENNAKVAACDAAAKSEMAKTQESVAALNKKIADEQATRAAAARSERIQAIFRWQAEKLFWLADAGDEFAKDLFARTKAKYIEKFGQSSFPAQFCKEKAACKPTN